MTKVRKDPFGGAKPRDEAVAQQTKEQERHNRDNRNIATSKPSVDPSNVVREQTSIVEDAAAHVVASDALFGDVDQHGNHGVRFAQATVALSVATRDDGRRNN